jgi:hypothetical protein
VNIKRLYVNWNGSITYNDHTVYKNVVIKKGVGVSTIQMLSRWDPSGNNKYLDWILKMRTTTTLTTPEIKSFIKLYHNSPQKFKHSDLNKYKTAEEVLSDYQDSILKLSKSEMKKLGANIVAETDQFKLLEITTYQAARIYGSNTKWCITSNKENFDDYNDYTRIYFYILKDLSVIKNQNHTNIFHKLAVLIDRDFDDPDIDSIWDATDREHYALNPMLKETYLNPPDISSICRKHTEDNEKFSHCIEEFSNIKREMTNMGFTKINITLINKIIKNLNEKKL